MHAFSTGSLFRAALACAAGLLSFSRLRADKTILLIAGPPSHGPRAHEHNAGVQLLNKCLLGVPGVHSSFVLNGWPKEPALLERADAIIIYADGGPRHIALAGDHLAQLDRVLSKGVGLGLLHFAVEPTKAKGQEEFLRWVGGAFEINWSVNPHWMAHFTSLPQHPITRGVQPFSIHDEWYFNLRFVDGMKGITPLLVAVPDASTVERPDGEHSGNPTVRALVAKGEPQVLSWAYERPTGGRGFGLTGGHDHDNWGDENFRRLVLNAILWLAHMDVPAGGVQSIVTQADLDANLDPKPGKKAKK